MYVYVYMYILCILSSDRIIIEKAMKLYFIYCINNSILPLVLKRDICLTLKDCLIITLMHTNSVLIHLYVPDPFILPHQQVDKGAIKFVLSGANIMCPGLTSPGAKLYPAAAETVVVSF